MEQRLSGERVFDGRAIKLEVDRVRLDNGIESVREVLRHPGSVVIVPLAAEGVVTLVRQYRYAAGQAMLELPAGTLDPKDPSALAAAQRELAEETGLQAGSWRLMATCYASPGVSDECFHLYLATDLCPIEGAQTDADEHVETVRLPLAAAQAMARRGRFHDAKTVAGLLLVAVD